jgi:hypothetical protein
VKIDFLKQKCKKMKKIFSSFLNGWANEGKYFARSSAQSYFGANKMAVAASQVEVIEGAGHNFYQSNPEEFNRLALNFLNKKDKQYKLINIYKS